MSLNVSDEISSGVVDSICRTFGCKPDLVTRATQADDIDGWDSLSHAVLLVGIEKRFGLRLEAGRALEAENVGALIDLVREARSTAAAS